MDILNISFSLIVKIAKFKADQLVNKLFAIKPSYFRGVVGFLDLERSFPFNVGRIVKSDGG